MLNSGIETTFFKERAMSNRQLDAKSDTNMRAEAEQCPLLLLDILRFRCIFAKVVCDVSQITLLTCDKN